MKIKKTIGILSLLALGVGLLGCNEGVLLYQGKKGYKEVKYWKSTWSHLKEESKSTAQICPQYLKSSDYESKPAYLMEIKMPNGDIHKIRDINMDERITPEGDDKVNFTPKDEKTQWYDNSTHIGKAMLEKVDKLYQETLKEIKEDILKK